MKKLFLIFTLIISIFVFSKPQKQKIQMTITNSQDTLFWNGKPITRKALDDSLRVTFFKIYDSINKSSKNKKL